MICETISLLRKQRGWSQTVLAKKLGVSYKTIKNWEASISEPSAANIKQLALLFAVSADMLLGINSKSTISLESLPPADQRRLRAMIQAYISSE